MININQAIIAGNVAKEPELRYTKTGKPVVTFTVATNRYVNDQQEKPQYHRIVSWIDAETHAGLLKGDFVTIIGEIRNRAYEKDGQKRYITEIVAMNITVAASSSKESNFSNFSNNEENIPF